MRVLVLHSGGMDSTVCLYRAVQEGHEVTSVGISYGQIYSVELLYAQRQCSKLDVPHRRLSVEWTLPEHAVPGDRDPAEMQKQAPTFMPGRNAVFLSLACAEAASLDIQEVWIGVNAMDYTGYPDCRPDFIDAFGAMIKKAIPQGPRIVAPLLGMTKSQIAQEAQRLGIGFEDTWSCYNPVTEADQLKPCGRCDACVLHRLGWQQLLEQKALHSVSS